MIKALKVVGAFLAVIILGGLVLQAFDPASAANEIGAVATLIAAFFAAKVVSAR